MPHPGVNRLMPHPVYSPNNNTVCLRNVYTTKLNALNKHTKMSADDA